MTLDPTIWNRLSDDSRAFLTEFQRQHGRGPRMAHLGNIANNAYHAAKMMRTVGVEGDVLALHDYFIMSAPEWEEADMREVPADLFAPEWRDINLRGYERPRWYVQGPMGMCLDYVAARNRGDTDTAGALWQQLALENRTRHHAPERKPSRFELLLQRLLRTGSKAQKRVAMHVQQAVSPPDYWPRLEAAWKAEFPEREDRLRPEDVMWGAGHLAQWIEALRSYDFVIGYSTYGLFPLLCDMPYLCFEHGTLRDIPFDKDAQGRSTALSYRLADHTFVTNFDCVPKADIICPGRYTYINHPYFQDHGQPVQGVQALRDELRQQLQADFLVFFPTRHDWVPGTGYADKCNDVMLRAIGRLTAAGHRIGVVLCGWGQNIAQSRELIAQLGLQDRVRWIPPAAAVVYNRHCQASDLVADQYKLGAFGGVLYKALCNRTPVISFLDESLMEKVYPEMPPILNGRTTEELEALLLHAMQDPAALRRLGEAGRAWVDRHHDGVETMDRMLRAFCRVWQERKARDLPA
jgi:glycosyltransferase involved in cell wall biosynthesis